MRPANLKRLIDTLFKSSLMASVVAGQNQTIGLIDYDNLDDSNLMDYMVDKAFDDHLPTNADVNNGLQIKNGFVIGIKNGSDTSMMALSNPEFPMTEERWAYLIEKIEQYRNEVTESRLILKLQMDKMVSGVEATHVANREIWKDSIENKLDVYRMEDVKIKQSIENEVDSVGRNIKQLETKNANFWELVLKEIRNIKIVPQMEQIQSLVDVRTAGSEIAAKKLVQEEFILMKKDMLRELDKIGGRMSLISENMQCETKAMKDGADDVNVMEGKMLGGFSMDCDEMRAEYKLYFMNVVVHTIRTYPFVVMGSIALIFFSIGVLITNICLYLCFKTKCKTPRIIREEIEVATQLL